MWRQYNKAILGLIVAFVGALEVEVQSGSAFDLKAVLLALATATVTSYGVYAVPNKAN